MSPPPLFRSVVVLTRETPGIGTIHTYSRDDINLSIQVYVALRGDDFRDPPRRLRVTLESLDDTMPHIQKNNTP